MNQSPKYPCSIKSILKGRPIKLEKMRIDFIVSVNNDGNGSNRCRIPKPIYELLGNPDRIVFSIKKNGIEVFDVE